MRPVYSALALALFAGAARADITVSGAAAVRVKPDFATLRVEITASAANAADARSAVEKDQAAVTKAIEAAKVKAADITSSKPLAADTGEPAQRLRARAKAEDKRDRYLGSASVAATLHDLSRLAPLIEELNATGRQVHVLLGISDVQTKADAARKQALADARRRAGVYAREADLTLGRVRSISEGEVQQPRFAAFIYSGEPRGKWRLPAVSEHALTVSVRVSYAIKE